MARLTTGDEFCLLQAQLFLRTYTDRIVEV